MQLPDLDDLRGQLAVMDARREALAALISAAEAFFAQFPEGERVVDPVKVTLPRNVKSRHQSGQTVLAITEGVALEFIETHKRPVQTREVIEIMRERNLPLPSKSHVNVISARLSNSEKLEGRRGLGWWPRGRPWPDEEPGIFDKIGDIPQNENGEATASPETEEANTSS